MIRTVDGCRKIFSCGQNTLGECAVIETDGQKLCTPLQSHCVAARRNVIDVACGNEYTLWLCADGTAYAMGLNASGQCGSGDQTSSRTPVQVLCTQRIAYICAANGCEHSFLIDESGNLLACGSNSYGQLGLEGILFATQPRVVSSLLGRRVLKVACSYQHSCIVTDRGEMWTWGRNDAGQLGLGDLIDRNTPQFVEPWLAHEYITSIACGNVRCLLFGLRDS
jgi:alpha-tubulin suppressor-like RCC1 family protein